MTEPVLPDTDARVEPSSVDAAITPTATRTPRRRGGGVVLVVLLLLAAGATVWVLWTRNAAAEREAGAWQQESAALRERVDALDAALKQAQRGQQANSDRLDAFNATNRVLREELLATGERAALLEDAVARLADQRLRGETVLRLNEAEFLLLLGAERLRLFGDPASAIQAFSLAEASLGSLDDPALSTLRQTLAQELIELRSVPPDPRPQLRAELGALAASLNALAPSRSGEIVATGARDSRLAQLLSQLVTVRRVAERDAALGPVQRDVALAGVRLQIELAQAALARPDPAAYRAALDQVSASGARLFDRADARTATFFASLDRLKAAELLPELPALGATLQELRGLRAARTIGRDDAAPTSDAGVPAGNDAGAPATQPVANPATAPAPASEPPAGPQVESAVEPPVEPAVEPDLETPTPPVEAAEGGDVE